MFINFENETLQYYTKLEEKSFHLPQLLYFVATFFLYMCLVVVCMDIDQIFKAWTLNHYVVWAKKLRSMYINFAKRKICPIFNLDPT